MTFPPRPITTTLPISASRRIVSAVLRTSVHQGMDSKDLVDGIGDAENDPPA